VVSCIGYKMPQHDIVFRRMTDDYDDVTLGGTWESFLSRLVPFTLRV
jgi:hypothetical protein